MTSIVQVAAAQYTTVAYSKHRQCLTDRFQSIRECKTDHLKILQCNEFQTQADRNMSWKSHRHDGKIIDRGQTAHVT